VGAARLLLECALDERTRLLLAAAPPEQETFLALRERESARADQNLRAGTRPI
jgi:hypothetical protein